MRGSNLIGRGVTLSSNLNLAIIGPYFFEDDERAGTVTAARYREMLSSFLFPKLYEITLGDVWFQQDGATAHTARDTMQLLREHFPERLISLRGDLPWPARSPDLTPGDFFYGVTSNPSSTMIAHKPYFISRTTFVTPSPIYPSLC